MYPARSIPETDAKDHDGKEVTVYAEDCLSSRPHDTPTRPLPSQSYTQRTQTCALRTHPLITSHNAVADMQTTPSLQVCKKGDAAYWFPFLKQLLALLKAPDASHDTQALLMVRGEIGKYLYLNSESLDLCVARR